ncbi:RICIN domain-containing protein [Streptomyces sp. NPDC051976]|uniref:RICIN domain-containing protein n=1 Tax=Streptomyces sp. NPDC051976 TaxID=3154947 RepID=UPI003430C471
MGNPGFESGSLSPWYAWNSSVVSTESPRTGGYALKIGTSEASAEQVVSVQPNTTYRLSGWLKSGAAGEPMVLGVKDNYGGPGKSATTSSTSYTEADVVFTTGAGNTQATVYCYKNTSSAPGYCDDVALIPISSPNLMGNPGFESGSLSPWYAWNNSVVSAESPRSGGYALKIGTSEASAEQVVSVQPNTTYRLSGWLKSGAAGEPMVLGVKDNYGGPGKSATTSSTSYTEADVVFTTGASNTQVTVYCYKNSSSAPGYCDDLTLTNWITVNPARDTSSVIKNPAMGWQLYVESTTGLFPDAATFWSQVDPYRASASELYIRMPWSAFEPTQGHFAWNEDANFIALVQGAQQRGLKLAFRINEDSQDYTDRQSTPQYVFDAGAAQAPALSDTGFRDPVLTDPVYRQKFATFLTAFAARFNDPAVTDFVDTTGLGWWGEGHHTQLATADLAPTLTWVTNLYAQKLDKVLLNLNYGGEFSAGQDPIYTSGFAIRRDSLGSSVWFPTSDQDAIKAHFPATAVFGENCYQSFATNPNGCDGAIGTDGIRTVLTRVVADAKNIHANTLDLRWPANDVPTWVRDNPDLVQDFALNGGYRIAPDQVGYPSSAMAGATVPIIQTWSNTGVGELPNDLAGWNHKYKVSYALLKADGTVAAQYVDPGIDPGAWVKGAPSTSASSAAFTAPAGTYQLAVAIVDSANGNTPAINLALTGTAPSSGWRSLGAFTVTPAYATWSLQNGNSGLAADVQNGSTSPGAPVLQWPYLNGSNQQWQFNSVGNGYYHVVNAKSGLCLDVSGSNLADGASVIQSTCGTSQSQSWATQDFGDGNLRLQAEHSLKCLDVQGASTAQGAFLVQNTCALVASQEWTRIGVQ